MKNLFLIIFITFSPITFAQISHNLGDFNKVTVFDQIDVLLIHSTENKIILSGTNSEEVELINKNGELKIRLPFLKMLAGDAISATVYYTNIDAVEANEGSIIASEETIENTNFNIITKEGSQVLLTLNINNLKVLQSSGSDIELTGNVVNQEVVLIAGSVFNGKKLISKQTIISANAGSVADINVTDYVDAKIRAGGTITIFGNPKTINKKTIAGGKIIEIKN